MVVPFTRTGEDRAIDRVKAALNLGSGEDASRRQDAESGRINRSTRRVCGKLFEQLSAIDTAPCSHTWL